MRFSRCLGALAVAVAMVVGCGAPSEHDDVVYDARYGDSTSMDVYVPSGAGPHPGVLLIHGGAWKYGSKEGYGPTAARLARSGYVAATINYRLIPDGAYPRLVQDCLCALSHFRKHAGEYGLDPDRVAVMGYSAGGHLASLLGVAAEDPAHAPDCDAGPTKPPRAVIAGAGVHDFRSAGDNALLRELMGGSRSEVPDHYVAASPLAHIGPNKPPFLFVGGTSDWFVDIDQSRAMRDALVASGNDAQMLDVTGAGHLLQPTTDLGNVALDSSESTSESWLAIIDFLERTMGPR
jgi:acetyl esterase/lipase